MQQYVLAADGRPHRDELFRRRRMNSNRRIEVRLRSTRLNRDRESLQNLARIGPDHMQSDHTIALTIDNQFHQSFLIASRKRLLERPEDRAVHIDPLVLLTGLGFRQSDRANRRLRENGRRHVLVIR